MLCIECKCFDRAANSPQLNSDKLLWTHHQRQFCSSWQHRSHCGYLEFASFFCSSTLSVLMLSFLNCSCSSFCFFSTPASCRHAPEQILGRHHRSKIVNFNVLLNLWHQASCSCTSEEPTACGVHLGLCQTSLTQVCVSIPATATDTAPIRN